MKNNLRGRYSNQSKLEDLKFFDSPSTSSQDFFFLRTTDTSTDQGFPSTKFRCTKKLEDGSASTLFEGVVTDENGKDKDKVIIKRISKKDNWRKELEVLKNMQNSTSGRILKYIGFYESYRSSFIVTEYYPGFDLFEHIDVNIPYSELKGLVILREMSKCIKECHDKNIIHLDIKCENYMVNSEKLFDNNKLVGKIVLIDFGHSEIIKEGESIEKPRVGLHYGTPRYVCPEGFIDEVYSSKSDIWSLGVCLSIILTGDLPFSGNGSDKTYYKNSVEHNFRLAGNISEESKDIIKDCLNSSFMLRPSIDDLIKKIDKRILEILC